MSSPHDFDFFHGRWAVHHRRLKDRLAGCTEWEVFGGTSSAQPLLGGAGNVDDNVIELPGGTYRAATLRAFDPASKQWAIWWLDGRHPHAVDVPMIGRRSLCTPLGLELLAVQHRLTLGGTARVARDRGRCRGSQHRHGQRRRNVDRPHPGAVDPRQAGRRQHRCAASDRGADPARALMPLTGRRWLKRTGSWHRCAWAAVVPLGARPGMLTCPGRFAFLSCMHTINRRCA